MLKVFKDFYGTQNDFERTWSDLTDTVNGRWDESEGVSTFAVQISKDIIVHIIKMKKGAKLGLRKHPFIYKKILITDGVALFNQSRRLVVGSYEKIPVGYSHQIEAVEDLELISTFNKR